MHAIDLDFSIRNQADVENLYAILGHIRGEAFSIKSFNGKDLGEDVWAYIFELQAKHRLPKQKVLDKATIGIINKLFAEKQTISRPKTAPKTYTASIEKNDDLVSIKPNVVDKTAGTLTTTSEVASVEPTGEQYKVHGVVRDAAWKGVVGRSIHVYEKKMRNQEVLLGEAVTNENGAYEVLYNPPVDPKTKAAKKTFHLIVKALEYKEEKAQSKTIFNAKPVEEVDFTAGNLAYQGPSIYEMNLEKLECVLGADIAIATVEESAENQDVTFLHAETQMVKDEIMKMVLAHRVSAHLKAYKLLTPEVIYAFLYQNAPSNLPSYLLPVNLNNWERWIAQIVPELARGVVVANAEAQHRILQAAVSKNIVPIQTSLNLDAILKQMDSAREASALNELTIGGKNSLAQLLALTSVKGDLQAQIGILYAERWTLDAPFYEAMGKVEGIEEKVVEELKTAQTYAEITQHHFPMMELMHQNVQTVPAENVRLKAGAPAPIYRISDYAKWTEDNWQEFVKSSNVALPKDIYIENVSEKQQFYATSIYEAVERAFPSIALLAEVGRTDKHELKNVAAVAQFLDNTPNFNLKTDHIDVYNRDNSKGALGTEATAELKLLKRIGNVAPNSKVGTAMLSLKIHSAGQVYGMGEAQFKQKMADAQVTASLASQAYNNAAHQYANAVALASTYGFNQQGPKAIINLVDEVNTSGSPLNQVVSGLPDLETLFGSLDYCECQHCKSVYSPAAYLTDLLRFLDEKIAQSGGSKTVKDILLERRPDIDDIGLNCENAHKPLPYIDLVCEVLEHAIKAPSADPNFAHNTTLSAEQLQAIPQYLRADAYSVLALDATYPKALNLWLEEAGVLLEHLGIPYYELMQTWRGGNGPSSVSIAAAYFNLPTSLQQFVTVPYPFSGTIPSRYNVALVLEGMNITYGELLELLQTDFVNPSDGSLMVIEREAGSCAINKQELVNGTNTKIEKLIRFTLLWRALNWDMWELDLLIMNPKIGNGTLNAACLQRLKEFHELQQRLGLSVEELVAFYDDLDIMERRDASNKEILNFYSRLFLNPAVDNPHFATFEIPVVTSSSTINQTHSSTIAAVLKADEAAVFNMLSAPGGPTFATGLNTLSFIYRKVTLAKKLDLSIAELDKLIGLSGLGNVFGSMANTKLLLDYKEDLDNASLSIDMLDYLMTDNDSLLDIKDTTIEKYLTAQRQAMLDLKDDLFNTNESQEDLLRRHLAKLDEFTNETNLKKAIELIFVEGDWYLPVLSSAGGLGGNSVVNLPVYQTFVQTHFNFVRDTNAAITMLNYQNDTPADINNKVNYLLTELEYYFNRPLVQLEVTKNLGLPEETVDLLLKRNDHSNQNLLTVLRNDNLVNQATAVTYANYTSQYDAYRLLHKMTWLVDHWGLSAVELNRYISHYNKNTLEILHLNTLPIKSSNAITVPSNLLIKITNWWKFIELDRANTTSDSLSIQQIWAHTTMPAFLDDLSAWTGWDRMLLEEVVSSSVFSLGVTRFHHPDTFANLGDCFQQLHILGVQIPLVQKWILRDGVGGMSVTDVVEYQQEIANEVKKAAKAKYAEEEWLTILDSIQDILRVKKRDALVEYLLLKNNNWDHPNDLFQHYLIDVEMSPCQMTSRLKQAISSVQLFVQRCIMNLEPNVVVNNPDTNVEDNWKQWKWMQYYRVWEANRKVFLYPENWIEPELRDDKSIFFKELENDLLQKEITHENVEEAFGRYLEKVGNVAHMDIMGMCHGKGPNGEDVQHVLGRTKEIPGKYYFRTYNEAATSWTAWEPVEVGIQGEHAIPYVYNNKVHIFWLEILEKPMPIQKNPSSNSSERPTDAPENPPMLEIQLAWTVLKAEGWKPKAVSRRKLIHPWPRPAFSLHLRPNYRASERELRMDLFVSTSKEFNDKEFYDQYTGNFERLANANHDETYRPWHSSSFVFDGRVRAVELLGLAGDYYLPENIEVAELTPVEILNISTIHGTTIIGVETNYGLYYYNTPATLPIPNGGANLSNLNAIIDNNRPPQFTKFEITQVTTSTITTLNHGTFNTNSFLNINSVIANDVLPPLEINSTASGSFGAWTISTNYGSYTISMFNVNSLGQFHATNTTALNNKIAETRSSHLPALEILAVVGNSSKSYITTTQGIFSSANFQGLNNLIATGNPLLSAEDAVLQAPLVNPNSTDSYTYVRSVFGETGRQITPLITGYSANEPDYLNLNKGVHFNYNHWVNIEGNNKLTLSVPNPASDTNLLNTVPTPFKVTVPMENHIWGTKATLPVLAFSKYWFFAEPKRTFFVRQEDDGLDFYPFYHPYTDSFISELNKGGVDALLNRKIQVQPEFYYDNGYQFSDYNPLPIHVRAAETADTKDIVDFSSSGAYSGYNWEIFFHIPLLIATSLSKNQRFEEAMRWFHYIFDPTNTESSPTDGTPQRYWITKPFYKFEDVDYQENQIETILDDVSIQKYRQQVVEWKNNPFMPHVIARYRPVAYQRNVVMKYIDNLIAWGDQLFRRETLESMNQATLLYVLAHELLGDRPVEVTSLPVNTKTYSELDAIGIDYFGNSDVLIAAEGLIAGSSSTSSNGQSPTSIPMFTTKYFCIPFNEKLLGYWNLVEDRLFKIRHCMNIDGVVRQLPLFAPPIDPALLVNAAANGVDLGSVLDNLNAPKSYYRYRTLSAKAAQFCSEVKSLGQSLLSALQSKDTEGMALLQSANAISILEAVTSLKESQIKEAEENIESLKISKSSAVFRQNFYSNRAYLNKGEANSLDLGQASLELDKVGNTMADIASILAFIPEFSSGVSGLASPVAVLNFGGKQLSKALELTSGILARMSNLKQKEAGLSSQKAGYKRRQEEWDLQIELAGKEIEQIEKQIAMANIRLAVAQKDLDNHKLQIENSRTEEAYLKSKYTNQQLYSWMTTQISTTYFQAYQLAYDMAKRAEKSFRYELALPTSTAPYIKFGYWDSLKKGLLSGDKLMLAINKMDAAYFDQNGRDFELTKQISLRTLAPEQLLDLKLKGSCTLEIPEWWFDMDYPGHYMRRIKSVSLSIPCIVGPYTNVNCTLTLQQNKVRHCKKPVVASSSSAPSTTLSEYAIDSTNYNDPDNYTIDYSSVESIATSHGQSDSGLFELNFNDERYLPFEGAGVISRWELSLSEMEQFDYSSISDVVLHVRYMARRGNADLAKQASGSLKHRLNELQSADAQSTSLISLKQEFGTAWHRFIHHPLTNGNHELNFELMDKHYPFYTRMASDRKLVGDKVSRVMVVTKSGNAVAYTIDLKTPNVDTTSTPDTSALGVSVTAGVNYGEALLKKINDIPQGNNEHPLIENWDATGAWKLTFNSPTQVAIEDIEDIILLLEYTTTF